MSETVTTPETPPRRISWLVVALVASLALNLLVAGAAAARWYVGFGPERVARLTQSQLIPRPFFHDLDRARRMELLAVLKAQDKDIRAKRAAVKSEVLALADALEAEPYDPARVSAAVQGFTAKSEALFATGADAALAVFAKLTPDERKLMASQLRAREERGRKPADDKKPEGS